MLRANSGPHAKGTLSSVLAVYGHDIQAGRWPGRVRTLIKVHGIQDGPGLQADERMGARGQHETGILLGSSSRHFGARPGKGGIDTWGRAEAKRWEVGVGGGRGSGT
jgi:hypothetical protein